MAGPKPIRWLIWLGLPALVIVALSLWAIDRPNVVWSASQSRQGTLMPLCPLCRTEVRMYAKRCPTCQQDVEWVVAPPEDSPICSSCLSPGEAESLATRRRALGDDVAADRVAKALGISLSKARAWITTAAPGACGWCGGTGHDPAVEKAEDCPVCFGGDECIACDGTRRVTIGKEDADVRLRRYERMVAGLGTETPLARKREEVRDANEGFLAKDVGTVEAQSLLFWPAYGETGGPEAQPLAAGRAGDRVVRVLRALKD